MSDTNTLGVIAGLLGVVVTQTAAIGAVWLDVRSRSRRAEEKIDTAASNADVAAVEAATAAKRAEPISNGFAEKVLGSLEQLKRGQSEQGVELHEVRQKLDGHIGDHASADVRRGKGG